MSEGAQKIAAWREGKRQAGYKSVQLWLPIEFIGELTALAYRHQTDLSSYIMQLVHHSAHDEEPVAEVAMKTCGQGHTYPQNKHGCPTCARNRKRRQRARA